MQNPCFGKSLDPRGCIFQYIPPLGSVLLQSFPRECIRKSFPVYRERQSRSRLVAHCTIYGCTKSCLDLITSHQPYISLWPSATAMESNLLYKTCNTRRAPNSSSVCLNTGLYASVTATLMPYLAYQSLCRPHPQQA